MNYLEIIAVKIKARLPEDLRKYDAAFYLNLAALSRSKGIEATASDVHDMWNATLASAKPGEYLPEFEMLWSEQQEKYLPYVEAVHDVVARMTAKRQEYEAIVERTEKLWRSVRDQHLALDDVLQEMDEIFRMVDNLAPKLYQNWIDAGDEYICQVFIDEVIKPYRNLVAAQTPEKRGDVLRIFYQGIAMLQSCLEYDGFNPHCPLWRSETEGL